MGGAGGAGRVQGQGPRETVWFVVIGRVVVMVPL